MSSTIGRAVPLGDVDPAGSRHMGRRSAVVGAGGRIVVGTADGTVTTLDRETLEERWSVPGEAAVVSAAAFGNGVVVGERGPDGEIRLHDRETGTVRWRYRTADDVGEPEKETRFFLPFVLDVVADDRLYAAARRYDRTDGSREFTSAVYAFDADGAVEWTYRTDASPISLDARDDRVAVGYNRCPGDHGRGLVVLDAGTGGERWSWDPGTGGQRRVGDVSLLDDGVALTSHGDYRGYRLDTGGGERWSADLATPVDADGETLYAYPNHVHATPSGVVFVTGNTYPEDGRETDSRHPNEHTAFGYSPDGERRWTASVGGFVGGIGTDGDLIGASCAQNFRTRDPETHGLRVFDVRDGHQLTLETEGVVTATSLDDGTFAAVEEPVVYHDDGTKRGAYRLHAGSLPNA